MAKKRGNSEGSIYEDANGRWRASVHIGWANGKRVRKLLSGRTRAEVAQKLTEALRNQQLGIAPAVERQTVAQYLQHWLEHVAGKQVRPKTLKTYQDIVAQHLIPALGTVPLPKLSVQKVREFMSAKLAQRMNPDEPATFSARTVKHMRDTLRAALNVAVRDGVILRNPAALAAPPRETTKHEPKVLGPEEARAFMGLPDVVPFQNAMLDDMKDRVQKAAASMEPEAMLKTFFPMQSEGMAEMQKAFWSQFTGAAKSK